MTEELKDLKTGDDQPGDSQPEKNEKDGEKTEESVEELKKQIAEKDAKMAKILSDNENYKQAIISKNAKNFSLSESEEEEKKVPARIIEQKTEEEKDEEKKAWERVRKEAENVVESKYVARTKAEERDNEKVAIKRLFKDKPEVAVNEAMKSGIREYYVNRNGKSVEGIRLDMEEALEYWAFKNKVDLNPSKKDNSADVLASVPTGRGGNQGGSKLASISPSILAAFPDLAGKPELLKQYREKVLSRELRVPEEVYNLFANS